MRRSDCQSSIGFERECAPLPVKSNVHLPISINNRHRRLYATPLSPDGPTEVPDMDEGILSPEELEQVYDLVQGRQNKTRIKLANNLRVWVCVFMYGPPWVCLMCYLPFDRWLSLAADGDLSTTGRQKCFQKGGIKGFDRFILLLRNPFDAI